MASLAARPNGGPSQNAAPHRDHVTLIEEPTSKATPSQAVNLLINAAVGAGVLSLPYAFMCAGWAGGALILAIVATVESFTLYVLSRWAERTRASSYGELVHRALGPAAATGLCLVVFLYLFGSCVAYLIILGDCFHPILSRLFGHVWYTSRKAAITGVGTFLVLPLCFAETLSAAKHVSSINFVAFIVVIMAILGRSAEAIVKAEHPMAGAQAFAPGWAAAVPIAVFGLQCHAQVVAVFNELRVVRKNEELEEVEGSSLLSFGGRLRTHKLRAMTKVIITAIAITAAGYAIVGLSAYLAFPTTVKSNVLNTFPQNDIVMQGVRALVGLLEIASYPVNHLPARQAIRDAATTAAGVSLGGTSFVVLETLVFYLGTLALALSISDLGAIFTLTGGLCGSAFILGMPGMLLIHYSWQKQRGSSQLLYRLLSHHEANESEDARDISSFPPYNEYNAWRSKLFWGGISLIIACLALNCYTVVTVYYKFMSDN